MIYTYITALMLGAGLSFSLLTQAQTANPHTDWLKTQLDELVDKEEIKPIFSFNDCQMSMNAETKEEGTRVRVNVNWPLKEIKKVSYTVAKDGKYTLVLDIPANKIKGKVKVGIFSKSIHEKGEGGYSSFDLNTKDEHLIQEIQQRFNALITQCQQTN